MKRTYFIQTFSLEDHVNLSSLSLDEIPLYYYSHEASVAERFHTAIYFAEFAKRNLNFSLAFISSERAIARIVNLQYLFLGCP